MHACAQTGWPDTLRPDRERTATEMVESCRIQEPRVLSADSSQWLADAPGWTSTAVATPVIVGKGNPPTVSGVRTEQSVRLVLLDKSLDPQRKWLSSHRRLTMGQDPAKEAFGLSFKAGYPDGVVQAEVYVTVLARSTGFTADVIITTRMSTYCGTVDLSVIDQRVTSVKVTDTAQRPRHLGTDKTPNPAPAIG
jgi:hypothetical protein